MYLFTCDGVDFDQRFCSTSKCLQQFFKALTNQFLGYFSIQLRTYTGFVLAVCVRTARKCFIVQKSSKFEKVNVMTTTPCHLKNIKELEENDVNC